MVMIMIMSIIGMSKVLVVEAMIMLMILSLIKVIVIVAMITVVL